MMFLERLFASYYRAMAGTIYVSDVPRREFMFRGFNGKVRRHISFHDLSELRKYLMSEPPLHAYYSVSLYRRPTAPMEEKEPIRAELLFDIDSTDFEDEECEKDSIWGCKDCGYTGRGIKPSECPKCGSERIDVNHWLNERCISLTKLEVRKLMNSLDEEFGVDLDAIAISYTGNRGFHVRVTEGPLTSLGKEERREIAFYMMGRGFEPSLFMTVDDEGRISLLMENGVMRRAIELLSSKPHTVRASPILKEKLAAFTSGRSVRLNSRERRALTNLLREEALRSGAKIDWMVTMDTGRLTRIPNSIHGKTGFRALSLTLEDYEVFDPFKDAVGLPAEPEVKVRVTLDVPTFRLKGENFGPYSPGDEVSLPGYAAAFLVLRGRAEST